jgi:hypothetical protein
VRNIGDIVERFPVLHALHKVWMSNPREPKENAIDFSGLDELGAFSGSNSAIKEEFGVLDDVTI